MTSLEYYIEQIEQFISALTDDIESGEGTIVTQTKLAVYREVLEHLEEIEQDPCEDAISREDALMCLTGEIKETDTIETIIARIVRRIRKLPPVNPTKTGHCKDCKYFEYDSVVKVDGIPLIVAHEICKRWGDGCKTKENGYCFMFEPRESED